jgi:hypothetical protein
MTERVRRSAPLPGGVRGGFLAAMCVLSWRSRLPLNPWEHSTFNIELPTSNEGPNVRPWAFEAECCGLNGSSRFRGSRRELRAAAAVAARGLSSIQKQAVRKSAAMGGERGRAVLRALFSPRIVGRLEACFQCDAA